MVDGCNINDTSVSLDQYLNFRYFFCWTKSNYFNDNSERWSFFFQWLDRFHLRFTKPLPHVSVEFSDHQQHDHLCFGQSTPSSIDLHKLFTDHGCRVRLSRIQNYANFEFCYIRRHRQVNKRCFIILSGCRLLLNDINRRTDKLPIYLTSSSIWSYNKLLCTDERLCSNHIFWVLLNRDDIQQRILVRYCNLRSNASLWIHANLLILSWHCSKFQFCNSAILLLTWFHNPKSNDWWLYASRINLHFVTIDNDRF